MTQLVLVFVFKQKTAYELRISDWSSDVCSSDLFRLYPARTAGRGGRHRCVELPDPDRPVESRTGAGCRQCDDLQTQRSHLAERAETGGDQIGRASCRERVCQYV